MGKIFIFLLFMGIFEGVILFVFERLGFVIFLNIVGSVIGVIIGIILGVI